MLLDAFTTYNKIKHFLEAAMLFSGNKSQVLQICNKIRVTQFGGFYVPVKLYCIFYEMLINFHVTCFFYAQMYPN